MCRGTRRPSVQAVGFNRPVGTELLQLQVSSGPFWTHKIKTKSKYLLSTPVSIPHVEAVLASLVVVSPSNCKFSFVSNFLFDC